MGGRTTPIKISAAVVGLNLLLNLTLIWPLAERGLAVSTAIAAALQVVWLAAAFTVRFGRFGWPALLRTIARTCVATLLMTVCGLAALTLLPRSGGTANELMRVASTLAVCGTVYFVSAWFLGLTEIGILFARRRDEPPQSPGRS